MNVLIVTNGNVDYTENIRKAIPRIDYIICADGGIKHLSKFNLWPDLIVGDLDSAEIHALEYYINSGVKLKRFSPDKDKTDTHIAVECAVEAGAKHVTLLGALGSRFDHSYANIMLLYRMRKSGMKAKIIDNHNHIVLSEEVIEIEGDEGQLLSVLPFGGEAFIAETHGLKYPIINRVLPLDDPYGVSNVLSMPKAVIEVKSGCVLVVLAWD